MASNSLLESYIDVVNENLKMLEKKFSGNIFRLAKFLIFRNMLDFQKCCEKSKIFRESKNIFQICFFINYINIAFQ